MSKQRARDQQPQALEQPTPASLGVRGKDSNEDEQQWLKQYSSTTGLQALGTSSPIPPSYSLNSQFFWFFARISRKEWNSSNTGIFLSLKGVCLETLPRPRSRWKITKIQRDWKCSSLGSSETKSIYKIANLDVNAILMQFFCFWQRLFYICVRWCNRQKIREYSKQWTFCRGLS